METLPERPPAFKHPRLTVTSANHGPTANPIRDRAQRGAKGLPDPSAMPPEARMESEDAGWQAHRRARRLQSLPNPAAWPPCNRLVGLLKEVVEEDSAFLQEYPKLPSQFQKFPVVSKTKRRPAVRT